MAPETEGSALAVANPALTDCRSVPTAASQIAQAPRAEVRGLLSNVDLAHGAEMADRVAERNEIAFDQGFC